MNESIENKEMRKIVINALLLIAAFACSMPSNAQKSEEKEKDLILTLNAANYQSKTKDGLVIVDFWAAWCRPCLILAPTLKKVAKEREGKVTIAKLNVDNYQKIATDLNISSIPTLVFYYNGEEVGRMNGVQSKDRLLEVIDELLLSIEEVQKDNQE